MEREEGADRGGPLTGEADEAGLDPAGDGLRQLSIGQVVAHVGQQGHGGEERARLQIGPEAAPGDPRQVADEQEAAPAAVGAAVAAGGEDFDWAACGTPQIVDQEGEGNRQVAGAEQHRPQDGGCYSRHRTANPQTCSSPE